MGQEQSVVDGPTKKDPRQRTEDSKNANQIVVVSNRVEVKKKDMDEDLANLRTTKLTQPILGNNVIREIDTVKVPKIVSGPLTEMILRFQSHLTECAEAVAFDQTALTKQIKETDILASEVSKSMSEKKKSLDKAVSQIETVTDVSNMLIQIERNMNTVVALFIKLNKTLPMEDQIYDPEFS